MEPVADASNACMDGTSGTAFAWRKRSRSSEHDSAEHDSREPEKALPMTPRTNEFDLKPASVENATGASSMAGSKARAGVSSRKSRIEPVPVSGRMGRSNVVPMSRNSGADVLAKLAARSSMNAAGPPVEVQSEAFLSRVNSPPHGPEATSNDTVGYAVRHGYGSLGMQTGTIDEDSDVDGWVSPLSRAAVSRTSDELRSACPG